MPPSCGMLEAPPSLNLFSPNLGCWPDVYMWLLVLTLVGDTRAVCVTSATDSSWRHLLWMRCFPVSSADCIQQFFYLGLGTFTVAQKKKKNLSIRPSLIYDQCFLLSVIIISPKHFSWQRQLLLFCFTLVLPFLIKCHWVYWQHDSLTGPFVFILRFKSTSSAHSEILEMKI